MPVASPLFSALKEGFQFLGKRLDAIVKAIKDNRVDLSQPIQDQTRILTAAVSQIQAAVNQLHNPSFNVTVDTKTLEKELQSAAASLQTLALPSTTKIEKLLSNMLLMMEQDKKASKEHMQQMLDAIKSINLQIPSTFKLDDMQVRSISSSRMPLNPAPLAPRSTTVRNVSMTSANTEYSITLSAGCTGYFIKLRAQNVILLLASATGKLPTSGDGSAYIQVPQNGMFSPMNMDIGGKTLYLQTGSASQVCEVQEFIN